MQYMHTTNVIILWLSKCHRIIVDTSRSRPSVIIFHW